MEFNIYGGGNPADPYNKSAISRVNDAPPGRYFVADARRWYVPQFYFNGSAPRWANWQAEISPAGIVVGDRLNVNLILEGTVLEYVVVHVKQASAHALTADLIHTGAVGDAPAGAAGDVVLGTIDFQVPGYYKFAVDKLWQVDGTLAFVIKSGNFMEACVTVSPALSHHNDGHACNCYVEPCSTTYPDPNCGPVTQSSGSGTVAG